ncbi:hypothetical protein GW17_00049506 [Ensete ventricosum]|nr:hypothetical protein GW17_00049506 [Ensete ventricosum]
MRHLALKICIAYGTYLETELFVIMRLDVFRGTCSSLGSYGTDRRHNFLGRERHRTTEVSLALPSIRQRRRTTETWRLTEAHKLLPRTRQRCRTTKEVEQRLAEARRGLLRMRQRYGTTEA